MLKIENLCKKFKHHVIFDKVNLSLENGDLVHLYGINGSGKSTLFKLIAGILEPDSGTITIDKNKRVGAVIENPGFIENETILYNLKYLYTLLNSWNDAAQEKIEKLCNEFNLNLYSKEKLKNYSLGMRQKVAIIQAIMEEQDIILLDEPIRGLDQEAIEEFFKIINNLAKKKDKIIIIASHDLMDKLNYNRKLIIKDCKIYDETSK